MSVIYEPKGRAREYAALATNVYIGCDHACSYCYAPGALQLSRDKFTTPRARSNYLETLEKEAKQLEKSGRVPQVLLSFACDPYSHFDIISQTTRKALEILKTHGIPFCTLTKGGRRALRDLDLFSPRDCFATTLTLLDDNQSREIEPGAALPQDRIMTIKKFYDTGIETWVSLEPVIDPDQTLDIIRQTHSWVDLYKVGKMNHVKNDTDWAEFGNAAVSLLESLYQPYYIKDDLAKYITPRKTYFRKSRIEIENSHPY